MPSKVLARNFGEPWIWCMESVMELESVKTTKIEGITSILNMKLHEEGGGGGGRYNYFSCLVGSFYGSLQIG